MQFPAILNGLIGQVCYNARAGYSGSLVLDFGEKIFTDSSIRDFLGEWSIRTESCTWRLCDNDNILCGYYDEAEENDKVLKKLLSLKLLDIKRAPFDVELIFENNYKIMLIGQSKDADHFGILAPNDVFVGFSPLKEWYIMPSNIPIDGLNEQEKLLDLHSEITFIKCPPCQDNDFQFISEPNIYS